MISSDKDLWLVRWQAIIRTNAGLELIGPTGTNVGEIWIKVHAFYPKTCMWNCRLEKQRHPFCLGLSVLIKMSGVNNVPMKDTHKGFI